MSQDTGANRPVSAASAGATANKERTLLIADDDAAFFKGKTVSIYVYTPPSGTSYDLTAHLLARYLPAHMPGNPSAMVKNMPGGGGLTLTRFLFVAAPKDGTAFGSLAQTLPLDYASGKVREFSATLMPGLVRSHARAARLWHHDRHGQHRHLHFAADERVDRGCRAPIWNMRERRA